MRWRALAGAAIAGFALAGGLAFALSGEVERWNADERAAIGSLGPWPPPAVRDPSNRVSGRPEAAALGEALFHSTRLSTVGGLRCATCHEPWRHFTDGRPVAQGAEAGTRNTPSVLNVRLQHWFGWDGANDSLWSQSIRPMLDPREMRSDARRVASALRDDENLRRLYAAAFGHAPPADDEAALVDAGKALAAYQETLMSERTPFDAFRDALVGGDSNAEQRYPPDALRGLKLFVGRGRCIACHAGPNFSDGEFHRSRIASKLPGGAPDSGRVLGLEKLLASPYTRGGRFNDDPAPGVKPSSGADVNAFRTPGLREVAATSPYMHDGSIARLCDAVLPHAALDGAPDAALSLAERREVVAFLRTLGSPQSGALVDEAILACR
jgi:cytochrome c peroxidase